MSMCYAGSAGITKTELKRLLSYRKNNDTETFKEVEQYLNNFVEVRNASYSLNIANRIFSKKDDSLINPSYLNLIKTYFKTDAQELNFTDNFDAVRTINNWVSNKTANRIKDLLTPDLINKYTKLVLVNAIYFKGLWLDRFNRSDTTKTPFYLANGTKTNVDMMVIKKKRFRCLTELDDLDASLCELPYEGEKIAMTIILPNKNSSLSKLEQKLDIKKLRNVLNKEKYLDYANIHLPKFKLEYKSEVCRLLIY
jgi:serine protease inhibitor